MVKGSDSPCSKASKDATHCLLRNRANRWKWFINVKPKDIVLACFGKLICIAKRSDVCHRALWKSPTPLKSGILRRMHRSTTLHVQTTPVEVVTCHGLKNGEEKKWIYLIGLIGRVWLNSIGQRVKYRATHQHPESCRVRLSWWRNPGRTPGRSRSKGKNCPDANKMQKMKTASVWICLMSFPTSLWGFCFLACIPPAVVRRRPPPSAAALSHTHITKLISSYTSHVTSYTTHPTSHTTHLTHNSSHTTLISHAHTSQNLSHTYLIQSHTQLISHTSSHTSHHTPLISHTHTHHQTYHTHTSSHTSHHTPLISHTHTHHKTYLIIHKSSHIIHNSSHTQLILHTTHLTDSAWQAQYAELPEEGVARIVAAVAAARCCVAGAVHRAFCRSWGADCRRLGRAFSVRGRRNTQSLLKELRRGLSPAGPRLSVVWQAQYTEPPSGVGSRIVAGWAAASLCVAGAVHRAFWRSCGADCRRLGRAFSLRGRRSTQRLLKELRRGLSPAGPRRSFACTLRLPKELRRGLSPAGPRLLSAWQAQYTEPFEGVVARIVAGWAAASLCVAGAVRRGSSRSWGADCRRLGRGFSLRGRRSTQSLLKELRRGLLPAGPRLSFAWQAQYTEPPEGAGARIVAGWAVPSLCVAGAVHRAFWRSCGADCRRLGRGPPLRGRRSTQSLPKELRRGLSPAGLRLSVVWQAQYTEPPSGVGSRIVAGWAAASFAWQAQYTEPSEGAAARIVAG